MAKLRRRCDLRGGAPGIRCGARRPMIPANYNRDGFLSVNIRAVNWLTVAAESIDYISEKRRRYRIEVNLTKYSYTPSYRKRLLLL